MTFRGVIPILQTPFHEDETIDLESLRREVDFAYAAGADGVAFPGFASEWWKLSAVEIEKAAEVIAETAKGRIPLVFNVTSQSTQLAVSTARMFDRIGCQGLMCLPPFIGGTTPEEVFQHVAAVLETTPLPFMLQWSPSLGGAGMDWEHLAELEKRFPQCQAVKVDFAPPGPTVQRLADQFGRERFTYLIGFAGLDLPDALHHGAHGLMGGCGHLRQDIAAFRALVAGYSGAGERFATLERLLRFEMRTIHTSIATHKFLLQRSGIFSSGRVRAPGAELDATQQNELVQLLEQQP